MKKWIENRWLIVFIRVKVIPCIECGWRISHHPPWPHLSLRRCMYVCVSVCNTHGVLPVCLGLFLFLFQPKLLFDCVDYFTHSNINEGNSSNFCKLVPKAFAHSIYHLWWTWAKEDEPKPKADFPYRFGNRQTMSIHNDLVVILCHLTSH